MIIPDVAGQSSNGNYLRPFLRWAGGKQNLVSKIAKSVDISSLGNGATYFEPFLGAGSLYFYLKPKRAVLSDANCQLINCFRAVKERPEELSRILEELLLARTPSAFLRIRALFNRAGHRESLAQAARFVYLNRASFNGIYRVNTKGKYNVPFGVASKIVFPPTEDWVRYSQALTEAEIISSDYSAIEPKVKRGDFVYLDPPYPPLNGSAYFTHYTSGRFGWPDHENLADFASRLDRMGCRVLISNADMPQVRRLYKKWSKFPLPVVRYVSCKAERLRVSELIITNY